jgi:hypothetical protein
MIKSRKGIVIFDFTSALTIAPDPDAEGKTRRHHIIQ